MKKLSDDHFDELLRQKAESVDYDFDESAWNKMEQKLRKRDRVVFIRNSSFILLLLLLTGGAFLLVDTNSITETNKVAKESKAIKSGDKPLQTGVDENKIDPVQELEDEGNSQISVSHSVEKSKYPSKSVKEISLQELLSTNASVQKTSDKTFISIQAPNSLANYPLVAIDPSDSETIPQPSVSVALENNQPIIDNDTTAFVKEDNNKSPKKRKKLTFSLTALAGPEFNSIKSIAGNKGTVTIGLLLNTAISNKISLSSGLKYGLKNYKASGYNYELQNPSRASQISGIDASCNILEIPLQVSYALLNNSKKKIAISSGLSSYLMLKEEYNFRYTPQSGRKDYLLVKNNANQHYLSVLNLSASYHIKPKSSSIQWSIEPYVKLPLGGVGEGNVKLKSSGVSLNLTYDISKKNK